MIKSKKLLLSVGAVFVFGIGLGTSNLLTQATQQSSPQQTPSVEENQKPIVSDQNEEKTQDSAFDLINDASLQRFLSDKHPFNDPKYIPEDLAPIASDFTTNAARKFQLRKEA